MKLLRIVGAFISRALRIAMSYRASIVLEFLGVILTLITFRLIAKLVGAHGNELAGGDYVGFAVVGLALSTALVASVQGPVGAVRGEQGMGSLEALVAQPLSIGELAVGLSAFPVLQGIVNSILVMVIATVAFHFPLSVANFAVAIPAIVLSAVAFMSLGLGAAAVVLAFQQGAFLAQWLAGALGLISGAFFPLALFHGWIRDLAEA